MVMIAHIFINLFKKRELYANSLRKLVSAPMVIIAISDTALEIQSQQLFHTLKMRFAHFTKEGFAIKDLNVNL